MSSSFLKIVVCLCFFTGVTKANDKKVVTKIQRVVVFLTGAQITRTATVNIAEGNSTIIFESISPDIDMQSLQVKAAGDFTILSVKQELDYINQQNKQKTVEELQTQPVALLVEDEIPVSQNSEITVETQQVSGGKLDALTGKVAWSFNLNPLAEKKLNLKYQVRYPKNQSVIVQ